MILTISDHLGLPLQFFLWYKKSRHPFQNWCFISKKINYIGRLCIKQLIPFYRETAPLGKKVRIENVSKESYDLLLDLEINKMISIHQ